MLLFPIQMLNLWVFVVILKRHFVFKFYFVTLLAFVIAISWHGPRHVLFIRSRLTQRKGRAYSPVMSWGGGGVFAFDDNDDDDTFRTP